MIPGGQKMCGPEPRPAADRFWVMVEKTETCWLWMGAKQPEGYGRFGAGPGKSPLAHRFAYELLVGPIADGMTIDHLCRNTSCVNPAHMEPVTREENAYRGNRNVAKTHCDHGHEFTPENTYVPPGRPHVRDCRACRAENSRRYHLARKAAA